MDLPMLFVMRLVDGIADRNHVVFTDNYYTSSTLAQSLRDKGMYLVGTIRPNRQGFPAAMKNDVKKFDRHAERGTVRYIRSGNILYLQWKDKRVVNMLSAVHTGHEFSMVTRNAKVDGQYQAIAVKQPKCVADYNGSMGGVDVFDQLIATHRVLRKSKKYWKSIFLDLLDVCAVNAYILFEQWRAKNRGLINRRQNYRHADFRGNLIRQLAGLDTDASPPSRQYRPNVPKDIPAAQLHLPKARKDKKNCKNCREMDGKQRQCVTYCATCGVHLHITSDRDCFEEYHLRHF